MEHKKRINETNFMRRMMGLQPINEGIGVDAADNEQMQLVSNVMTPDGTTVGGISTVAFKNSDEGREWASGDKKELSGERLKNATQQTFTDKKIGGWKIKDQGDAITIEDKRGVFFRVDTVTKGNPNWAYVATPSPKYPGDKDDDFIDGIGQSYQTYEEYATWIYDILHKYSPSVVGTTKPKIGSSWCKRDLDIDWYFDELKIGEDYLKKGDCGEAVEVAQDFINEYEGSEVIEIDGKYGTDTISQVKVVQDELDLKDDGYYGQKTHEAIIRSIGAGKGAPGQPEDDMERIVPKPPTMIDTDIDTDIYDNSEEEFDFDRDVKGGGAIPNIDIEDFEAVETEFEKKAKDKAEKRKNRQNRRGNRKLDRMGKRSSKLKKRYNFEEQKTFKVKKNGKVITLTESDVKKIINLKK